MAEILKNVFEDDIGNQYYLANDTETTYDQAGVPLNNGGDLSEASVNFSVGTARKALTPKARFKALMGDIAKWLTDLGTAAFCNVANNDTTTVSGFVADARIVKQHGDEIDGINSDLGALNDGGNIKGMDAREDGVYITYVPTAGADAVTKKLGNVLYAGILTLTSYNQNGPGNANFDLKPLLSNYASLTTANMCIEATYFKGFEARVNNLSIQGGTGYTYTYDAMTGILTVSGMGTVNYSYKSRPEKIKLVVLQDDIA